MITPAILIERDANIATVTLFNPDKLNAITAAMWRDMRRVMEELDADESLRCVVIRGEGSAFAAGSDIEEFLTLRANYEQAQTYHEEWVLKALRSITACRHPTVALIQGPCIGAGLEIACQCDLRIAAESAKFGAPIMKLGFPAAYAELECLLALAGPATVLEILLEGSILTAQQAYAKGLLTRVVDEQEAENEAYATAKRIAAGAPLVARAHKEMVRRLQMQMNQPTAEERRESYAYLDSEDYREGLLAFFEKRAPRFKGR